MDDIDRANDQAEQLLQMSLNRRLPRGPQPTGRCLYCDEVVDETRRWCSIDCREGWEKEAARKG